MNTEDLRREIEQLDSTKGISLLNMLEVSEPLAKVFRRMIRMRKVTAQQIAAEFELTEDESVHLTELLAEKGFLRPMTQRDGSVVYRVRFRETGERGLSSSVWDSFE